MFGSVPLRCGVTLRLVPRRCLCCLRHALYPLSGSCEPSPSACHMPPLLVLRFAWDSDSCHCVRTHCVSAFRIWCCVKWLKTLPAELILHGLMLLLPPFFLSAFAFDVDPRCRLLLATGHCLPYPRLCLVFLSVSLLVLVCSVSFLPPSVQQNNFQQEFLNQRRERGGTQ